MNDIQLEPELPPDHRSGFVAVIGRPSVGKSTLVNACVGQKVAIVSRKPQTTRNRILGILTRDDAQVIFVDTPGIHQPLHRLGEYMVKTAQKAVPDSDVVLFVVDATVMPTAEDSEVARFLARSRPPRGGTEYLPPRGRTEYLSPIILVLNKMDQLPADKVQPHSEAYLALGQFADWMMISALRSQNLDKLLTMTIAHLPPGPRYFPAGQVTDVTERFIAGELVREQVLRFLQQEVPYAIAVVVDEFTERGPQLNYIAATIYVEKDSQKGIVIGRGGKMLRDIGAGARREIEGMLDTHVFLELRVKVRPRWRGDEVALRNVGYR